MTSITDESILVQCVLRFECMKMQMRGFSGRSQIHFCLFLKAIYGFRKLET